MPQAQARPAGCEGGRHWICSAVCTREPAITLNLCAAVFSVMTVMNLFNALFFGLFNFPFVTKSIMRFFGPERPFLLMVNVNGVEDQEPKPPIPNPAEQL